MAEPDNLVVATQVRKEFGGLVATDDIDFTIPRGAIVSLIGPNGAGKTTFFNELTGVYKPTSGSIVFDGTEVSDLTPHTITKLGIGRTFQNIPPLRRRAWSRTSSSGCTAGCTPGSSPRSCEHRR